MTAGMRRWCARPAVVMAAAACVAAGAACWASAPALAALALELLVTGALLAVPAMALIVVPANNRPPARHCSLLRVPELVDARQGISHAPQMRGPSWGRTGRDVRLLPGTALT